MHIDRGYEALEAKLTTLGADIRRLTGSIALIPTV
jgi:UDP-N-acetylglucosamine enolpyruvyl transferase